MRQGVAVVGPTASGKTALGIAVAEALGSEVVSADSMQFYRGMEIGTGAPSAEEQARVKHHFLGFLAPNESMSAGAYARAARKVVAELNARGRPAVIVGGSGLYVRALIDGLFEGPGKDDAIRERLKAEARELGAAALYARLCAIDPEYASVIHRNDLRRIVRALEVYELTGRPASSHYREQSGPVARLDIAQVGIEWPREALYERINRRVDAMIRRGFVEEVRRLIEGGYGKEVERLKALGYRDVAAYLRGECALEDAVERIKRHTRRYAKRQLTWFRADKRIHWLPIGRYGTVEAQAERALALLRENNDAGGL